MNDERPSISIRITTTSQYSPSSSSPSVVRHMISPLTSADLVLRPQPSHPVKVPHIPTKPITKAQSSTVSASKSDLLPSGPSYLTDIPSEIIITIANKAGFRSSVTLMHSCRRLRSLLNHPSAWHDYKSGKTCLETVESTVTICTKLNTYDHLLFGSWAPSSSNSDSDSKHKSSGPAMVEGGENMESAIWFEHLTFSEQYDYLGGVALRMGRCGGLTSEFFEHKETLPCYQEALVEAVALGLLPPSAPNGGPAPGAKINHECPACCSYSNRSIIKDIFVFDQVSSTPRWAVDGFSWRHAYPDGLRAVTIRIQPFQKVLGYVSARDLPTVFVNSVSVGGFLLRGELYAMFQRLVGISEE